MKQRSITIFNERDNRDFIKVSEFQNELIFETSLPGITLNYNEIQELLDAIHTLQPPKGKANA